MNEILFGVLVLALAASAFYTGYWAGRSTQEHDARPTHTDIPFGAAYRYLKANTGALAGISRQAPTDPIGSDGNHLIHGTGIGQPSQPASGGQIPVEGFAVAGRQRPATWRERRRELEAKQRTKRAQREQWRG